MFRFDFELIFVCLFVCVTYWSDSDVNGDSKGTAAHSTN